MFTTASTLIWIFWNPVAPFIIACSAIVRVLFCQLVTLLLRHCVVVWARRGKWWSNMQHIVFQSRLSSTAEELLLETPKVAPEFMDFNKLLEGFLSCEMHPFSGLPPTIINPVLRSARKSSWVEWKYRWNVIESSPEGRQMLLSWSIFVGLLFIWTEDE